MVRTPDARYRCDVGGSRGTEREFELGGLPFEHFPSDFTTSRTEPVDGAAASPGQVGYVPLSMAGTIVGATITVFGRATALETFRVGSGQEPLTYSRPTQSIEEITAVR